MSVSQHEDKMLTLQKQVRENQVELQEYLADLDSWTSDIAVKEKTLVKHKHTDEPKLPPVRNSLDKKKRKKVKKKAKEDGHGAETTKRIGGYDYRAWDKFDIDKACKEVDGNEEKSSSEYETDEEWENERKKHLAEKEKENGNEHFKQGKYELAVESYTCGIDLDPANAILPANRAMAYLKLNKYADAVVDCTTAISLDPLYIKAYLRRASAKAAQHKLDEALGDYERVLTLEPNNKQAKNEKSKIQKEMDNRKDRGLDISSFVSSEKGIVKPVYKPPEQRSKKPLRRLTIEEIGHVKEKKISFVKESDTKEHVKKPAIPQNNHVLDKVTSEKTTSMQFSSSQLKNTQLQNSDVSDSQITNSHLTDSQRLGTPAVTADRSNSADSMGREKTPSSCTSVKVNSNVDRGIPQTSFQFQADYKVFKNNPEAFYNYFKKILPSSLPKLFGHSIEGDILMKIFVLFKDFFIPDGLDVLQYVYHLSKVNRFDVALMFLSSKEKQVICDVFDHLRKTSSSSGIDLSTLEKSYRL